MSWRSYLDAHKKDLDEKVYRQVEDNLKVNYKSRTDEVLDSAVKARTEISVSSKKVADLQKQAKQLDADLARFRENLAALEKQAKEKAAAFSSGLDRLAADFLSPEGKRTQLLRQQQFINKSREYAKRLGLTLPEPKIVFREDSSQPTATAVYDAKENEYIISPAHLELPGLAEYAALMGRFFEKNRVVLNSLGKPGFPESDLWQNFRQSVVEYLLVTDKIQPKPDSPDEWIPFYRVLTAMEKKSDVASVRKLAVALIESFGADWNTANFTQKVLAVNEKVKALSPEIVKETLGSPQ